MIISPTMWSKGYTGTGVTIAIIDTGCDTKHPELAGRIVGGKKLYK